MSLSSNPDPATSFWNIWQVAKPLRLSGISRVCWGMRTLPHRLGRGLTRMTSVKYFVRTWGGGRSYKYQKTRKIPYHLTSISAILCTRRVARWRTQRRPGGSVPSEEGGADLTGELAIGLQGTYSLLLQDMREKERGEGQAEPGDTSFASAQQPPHPPGKWRARKWGTLSLSGRYGPRSDHVLKDLSESPPCSHL